MIVIVPGFLQQKCLPGEALALNPVAGGQNGWFYPAPECNEFPTSLPSASLRCFWKQGLALVVSGHPFSPNVNKV